MWNINIEETMTSWYWILICIIGIVSTSAILIQWQKNQKFAMDIFVWMMLVNGLLFFFPAYLEPALFGWLIYTSWIMVTLSFLFFAMWGILVSLILYNCLRYGRVVM